MSPVVVGRPPPNVKPGRVIGDKYRIERELGRGGFGVVVRAVHLTLDQPVAIKVLTEGAGSDAEWAEDAERFRREARATAALRSEHVVRILDVDVLPEGAPYIVMEYLEGETLHHATYARGLAIEEAVDCAVQALAALAEAHAAGIVHRDLKPANVFLARGLDRRPIVKVLDFGVSKLGAGNAQAITRTGATIGTVAYMAPEQMLDAKRVDGRADVWSVGQILYEALTRRLPFGPFTSPTIVTAILTQPPVPASRVRPDLPPALDAILLRCFEKDASRRWQSAVELGLALEPFASPRARMALEYLHRAPPASGAAAPGPSASRPPRHSVIAPAERATSMLPLAVAFAVATIVLGIVAFVVLSSGQRPGGSTDPPTAPARK